MTMEAVCDCSEPLPHESFSTCAAPQHQLNSATKRRQDCGKIVHSHPTTPMQEPGLHARNSPGRIFDGRFRWCYSLSCGLALPRVDHINMIIVTSPMELPLTENLTFSSSIPPSASLTSDYPSSEHSPVSLQQPFPSNMSLLNDSTTFSYDLPPITNIYPNCDSERFGSNLNRVSCYEAWRRIGTSTVLRNVVQRRKSLTADGYLPMRYLSTDGLCAIDVVFRPGVLEDVVSSKQISIAADTVLARCVTGRHVTIGGYTASVGFNKNIIVIVRQYTPNVKCGKEYGLPPPVGSCPPVQLLLPVDGEVLRFGPTGIGMNNQVITPKTISIPRNPCRILVDVAGPSDTTTWFDLWEALVAINVMCLGKNQAGISPNLADGGDLANLGNHGIISIAVKTAGTADG
ncbi:hypothetical protein ABVK25_010402 [Lepraria finkii]|uniref:Uncharacterized protein n=1 Tax=Lepraria finkii TaxID=1340010 RepID=A0ABR4AVI4_9LECA